METGLNLSNLTVNDNGRVSFSGLSSGIDFQATINAILAAKRIPIDRLEAKVETNAEKIAALQDLRNLLTTMQSRLGVLRGAVTFGGSGNIFKAKQAFASTSRSDSQTPSAAANLIGVTVTNQAATGNHTLQIQRIATAHKIGTSEATSLSANLETAFGASGPISGDFTINGTSIQVLATDTLATLRDRINNANTGANATGVTASIVSISTTEHVLALTANKTGTPIALADPNTTGVLADLGISSDGGTTFLNELRQAQTAQFYADGILDPSQFQSVTVADNTAQLSAYTSVSGSGNTFEIHNSSGGLIKTVTYDDTDTLETLATKISGSGITGQVVADGSSFRLEIIKDDGGAITLTNDSNNLLADLAFTKKPQLFERSSNTISDVFSGVTMTLFQAEIGTTINLDIEQDLNQVKTAIGDFVSAYNDVKVLINSHQLVDPNTGEPTEETGVLFGTSVVSNVESQLSLILAQGAQGASNAFRVLAQIGIDFADNDALADPLLADTLEIDDTILDEALLNSPDDVRKLFAFDFTSSDSRLSLLSFTGNTTIASGGYVINIGNVGSARETSAAVNDPLVTLNDGVDGVGATTSGQFEINGTVITYDVTTDTLTSLATAINTAGITGISASVITNSETNTSTLRISSTKNIITVNNDTGDLLANLTLATTDTLIESANINGLADGSDDGSITISGRVLTATSSTGAEGLKMFFDGAAAISGIAVDFSIGLAANMYFATDKISGADGTVDVEIDSLEGQNALSEERITNMLLRLESERALLTQKFIAMETALSSMNQILEQIRVTTEAMFNNN